MINISISGIPQLQSGLEKMKAINKLVAQWMKSGSPDKIMQKSFIMNFLNQGRPDKWDYLSDETIRQRDFEGYGEGPILQRSGKLMSKITDMEGEVMVSSVASSMTWGINQLDGETKRKFGPNQIGKGRSGQDLPARPMIGFQTQDGKKLVTDLRNWILKTL
jgi:phage gpG-like protein